MFRWPPASLMDLHVQSGWQSWKWICCHSPLHVAAGASSFSGGLQSQRQLLLMLRSSQSSSQLTSITFPAALHLPRSSPPLPPNPLSRIVGTDPVVRVIIGNLDDYRPEIWEPEWWMTSSPRCKLKGDGNSFLYGRSRGLGRRVFSVFLLPLLLLPPLLLTLVFARHYECICCGLCFPPRTPLSHSRSSLPDSQLHKHTRCKSWNTHDILLIFLSFHCLFRK